MSTNARLTADDLWRMPAGDARRELVNGEIIEMAPAGALHGKLTARIAAFLIEHVNRHGGGEIVAGDVGFILNLSYDPQRVRGADAAFVSTRRLPEGRLPEKFLQGPPDLAVEILSPSESSVESQEKVRDYLEAGARLVWVVAPQSRTATVYRADGTASFLKEQDALEGEEVLPGFNLPLSSLFR